MDLNLSGWFVEIPAIVNIKILPAVETACDRWMKKPVQLIQSIKIEKK